MFLSHVPGNCTVVLWFHVSFSVLHLAAISPSSFTFVNLIQHFGQTFYSYDQVYSSDCFTLCNFMLISCIWRHEKQEKNFRNIRTCSHGLISQETQRLRGIHQQTSTRKGLVTQREVVIDASAIVRLPASDITSRVRKCQHNILSLFRNFNFRINSSASYSFSFVWC